MEQVEEICNHIILINKGSKILDGSVSKVRQDFKENLFSIGIHDAPAVDNNALFDVLGRKSDRLVVRQQPGVTNNQVLQYFIERNIQVESFQEILPSLNDIFIKLVEGTPTARQFEMQTI